jgi:putative membrane protein
MKFINSLTILILSIWIQYLIYSGQLVLYVHPRYVEFTNLSSIVSIIGSIICIYYFFNEFKINSINYKDVFNIGNIAILFLLIFITFPPTTLSSATAAQRGVGTSLNSNKVVEIQLNPFLQNDSQTYEISDWLNLLNYDQDLQNYKDKKVVISGFAFFGDNIVKDGGEYKYYKLSRFVITCCAVDARPVGLIVKYLNEKDIILKDKWYKVSGRFIIEKINGIETLVVDSQKAISIEQPDNPYIY